MRGSVSLVHCVPKSDVVTVPAVDQSILQFRGAHATSGDLIRDPPERAMFAAFASMTISHSFLEFDSGIVMTQESPKNGLKQCTGKPVSVSCHSQAGSS